MIDLQHLMELVGKLAEAFKNAQGRPPPGMDRWMSPLADALKRANIDEIPTQHKTDFFSYRERVLKSIRRGIRSSEIQELGGLYAAFETFLGEINPEDLEIAQTTGAHKIEIFNSPGTQIGIGNQISQIGGVVAILEQNGKEQFAATTQEMLNAIIGAGTISDDQKVFLREQVEYISKQVVLEPEERPPKSVLDSLLEKAQQIASTANETHQAWQNWYPVLVSLLGSAA